MRPQNRPAAPTGLLVDLRDCVEDTPMVGRRPRFSWMLPNPHPWPVGAPAPNSNTNPVHGYRQTAYRIQVSDSNGRLLHDTGKITSNDSVAVDTPRFSFERGAEFVWRVMVWDQAGTPSPWSADGRFRIHPAPLPKAVTPPDRLVVRSESSLAQTTVGPGHDFLDFGRALFGNVVVNGRPGERVIVRLGEKRNGNRLDPKPGRNVRFHEETVEVGADGQGVPKLRPADLRRMPAGIGPVMPFRYAEIERSPGSTATLRRNVVTVPFNPAASAFASSDPLLDSIWKLCKDTMEATSFCGVYVDGDRERLPYEADAFINMLGHYCVDRSYATARHSHELLLFEPTWPTEWILFSVLMAWQDYLHTGDPSSLERHANVLDAKSLRRIARPDGLISSSTPAVPKAVLDSIFRADPIRDVIDWPQGERDGFEMLPVNVVVNAFFLNALECLAEIFETVGRSGDARTVRVQRERTFTAFQRVFFNNDLGLYVDGEGARHTSIHANLFPLAFGLVPSDRIRKVADFVVSRGMACSVYAAQFLVDGLYRAGRGDAASALLVSRGERSWAHMVNDVGTTIALEAWDDRFKPNQDWNHAWGAAPANLIPRRVVGVEIAAPGARSVRVAPFPAHLTRFDALVPTIRGGVRVRYERDGNDDRYEVCLPPNCDGVFVPKERPGVRIASVWVDNRRFPADRPPLESTLLPGVVHRIVVRYAPA